MASPNRIQHPQRQPSCGRLRLLALAWVGAGLAMCLSASSRSLAQEAIATDRFGVAAATLPNGLRVVIYPKHAVAIAAVDIWVDAGTRRQKPGQEAVAHYLEHVLFTGTPTRPAETDVDGAIEDLGGTLDAATSYDWAHFYTVVPSAGLDGVVGVLGDVLQHPTLTQAAMDSERPIIESEIQGDTDDPATYASQATRAALFGGDTAYGQMITGTLAQADAVNRSSLTEFYHANYQPSHITVVIAGDVAPEQALASVQKAFGAWKNAPPASTAVSAAPDAPAPDNSASSSDYDATSGIVSRTLTRASPNSFLVFGWPAPSVGDQPDAWVMDVLLTYLGQGAVNLLDTDLRLKQHLVNAVVADYLTQRDPGILSISLSLPTANTAAAESSVLADVQSIRDQPLTSAQLAEAKQLLIASYLFQTETVSGKADSLGFYSTINSAAYDEQYIDHINTVTAQQVQQVAQKYLSASHYILTTLTPPVNPENAGLMPQPAPDNGGSELPVLNAAARASAVDGGVR